MNDFNILDFPEVYPKIKAKCKETGFDMPSDVYIGTFLKTLITSKPKSNILELGTGIGLSLAWMIDGLDNDSRLTTVDNDPELIEIAKGFFGKDERVKIVCEDGADWIKSYCEEKFDLIFADAWPGKYSELNETLDLVKVGGFYVIDDMNPQPNWPHGHSEKAKRLMEYLERRSDFSMTKMNWSTGLVLCTKRL
ncbi:methyltransferase domain-containing protein [Fulvivirga sp. M361]|uniref:O-methyltransferase n=1 Tax=Fulvivirga sp. M361 TaxID=2594266 RepID=UPI00117AC1CB|nr:class I SAM-dependent methyltransferase [Fulvivirga sp. M361]TRX58206.1 methyltransferase domain-containing protein [Fulvivirga sp. M361]